MRRLGRVLLFALAGATLAGCAALPLPRLGGAGPAATAPAKNLKRDELLTGIAACHLRRVAQNNDPAVTDAVVIAAVERYGFRVEDMVARANQLLRAAADPAQQPQMRELAATSCEQLAALTGVSPSLVRFDGNGRMDRNWVIVEGKITEGFADRVIARIESDRAVGLVIESPGGSLFEARKLGRYLREHGLRVAVNGLCTSACVDVLAGGIERYVTPGAKLGIHQSQVPKHLSTHEGGQLSVVASALYLREMGIDDTVALAAASVPNDSMYWITLPEALQTRLATKLVAKL